MNMRYSHYTPKERRLRIIVAILVVVVIVGGIIALNRCSKPPQHQKPPLYLDDSVYDDWEGEEIPTIVGGEPVTTETQDPNTNSIGIDSIGGSSMNDVDENGNNDDEDDGYWSLNDDDDRDVPSDDEPGWTAPRGDNGNTSNNGNYGQSDNDNTGGFTPPGGSQRKTSPQRRTIPPQIGTPIHDANDINSPSDIGPSLPSINKENAPAGITILVVLLIVYIISYFVSRGGVLVVWAGLFDKIIVIAAATLYFIASVTDTGHGLTEAQITLLTISSILMLVSVVLSILINRGNLLFIFLSVLSKLCAFVLVVYAWILIIVAFFVYIMIKAAKHSHNYS